MIPSMSSAKRGVVIRHSSLWRVSWYSLEICWKEQTPLMNSKFPTDGKPFSSCSLDQYCTHCVFIETLYGVNELPADVELFRGCHSDSWHTLSKAFLKSMNTFLVVSLMLDMFFTHDSYVCSIGILQMTETCLFFGNDVFRCCIFCFRWHGWHRALVVSRVLGEGIRRAHYRLHVPFRILGFWWSIPLLVWGFGIPLPRLVPGRLVHFGRLCFENCSVLSSTLSIFCLCLYLLIR